MIGLRSGIIASSSRSVNLYDGLISAYNFDSDATDQKGTNDGTLDGGETLVTGKIGNAYQFVASGYMDIGNSFPIDSDKPFSFAFWVKTDNGGIANILTNLYSDGSRQGFSITMAIAGDLDFAGRIGFQLVPENLLGLAVQTNNDYNDGAWHHVVCTYDGSSDISGLNIYVDGVSDSYILNGTTMTGSITTTETIKVGGRTGYVQLFSGIIDIVKIWGRELTSSEVVYDYNSGAGREYPA